MTVGTRTVRVWATALAGAVLLVAGLDVLTRRRFGDALRGILFRPEDSQLFEPRDMVWAAALVVVGGILTAWGLRELVVPRSPVRADAAGLSLSLRGPLRRPVVLPWEAVDDVGATRIVDEEEVVSVLWVRVADPDLLPADPWGARWIDESTVALFASGWDRGPEEVAAAITDVAVATAGGETE